MGYWVRAILVSVGRNHCPDESAVNPAIPVGTLLPPARFDSRSASHSDAQRQGADPRPAAGFRLPSTRTRRVPPTTRARPTTA